MAHRGIWLSLVALSACSGGAVRRTTGPEPSTTVTVVEQDREEASEVELADQGEGQQVVEPSVTLPRGQSLEDTTPSAGVDSAPSPRDGFRAGIGAGGAAAQPPALRPPPPVSSAAPGPSPASPARPMARAPAPRRVRPPTDPSPVRSRGFDGDVAEGRVAMGNRERADRMAPTEPAPEMRAQEELARPGLGTEFGEQRISPVRRVIFERSSPAPFATVMLHYNDASGVDAMARHDAAHGARIGSIPADSLGQLTVEVVDEHGQPLPAMRVGSRFLVLGTVGQRYLIRITNQSARNVEIVASVDGLDVVDGRPGSFEKRGYIVAAFTTLAIEGFRTSFDQVAAFRFGSVASSYAGRTGSPRNVGVIGVAFFSQRLEAGPDAREIELRESAEPFPANRFAGPM